MTMLCANPYVTETGQAFGCGQCMPCRYNRRRIWATRIMVEARQYKDNSFVTLTYAPDKDPGQLVPRDLQLFMKRLRKAFSPIKLRFFAVGEYGDVNGHPHFHLAMFNMPSCVHGQSRYSKRGLSCNPACPCHVVERAWGYGHIFLGSVEDSSAAYICGYVTKKMTFRDDPRLNGRHPEFARMSLKPGIGAHAMFDVADTLLNFQNTLDAMADVPGELMVGRSKLPLGRYLHRKLREYVGRDPAAPQAILDKRSAEMFPLRMAARADKENPSLKHHLIKAAAPAIASATARRKISMSRKKGRTL